MSENSDITKYFSDNNSGKFEEFFDRITNMSESNESLSLDEKDPNEKDEISNEPAVCKIFQSVETKKTSEYDSSNFFDVISNTTGNFVFKNDLYFKFALFRFLDLPITFTFYLQVVISQFQTYQNYILLEMF